MLLTFANADAQFGNLVNKAKNKAKSVVTEKVKGESQDTKNNVKEQAEAKVENTVASVASGEFGSEEGVPGNEMTSWAYAKDLVWDDITAETTAQDMMAAAINQIKKDKKNWEDQNRTEIFKDRNSASYFLNEVQKHPRVTEGSSEDDKAISEKIEAAKKYWIKLIADKGWNRQMDLAGLQSADAPDVDRNNQASYYNRFMWMLKKAEEAENPVEKVFDIDNAIAMYNLRCQFYDEFASTKDSKEYKEFIDKVNKMLSETKEAQAEYGRILDAPGDPAAIRAEFKAFEIEYNKKKAEEAKRAAAQYKKFIDDHKRGSNPAIEKLANQIYAKHCADGRKAVYTVSQFSDYDYDRTAFGQIIDRFWTVITVFKLPNGKYCMQNFSIKWMHQGGGKYSSTAQMRGVGTLTLTEMPWVE